MTQRFRNSSSNQIQASQKFEEKIKKILSLTAFLFLINLFFSPGRWWFFWPAFGMGIGLFFQMMQSWSKGSSSEKDIPEEVDPEVKWNKKDFV